MSIRHWPGAERPREKLLERGAHALSDAELVALLLGSGSRGRSAVELARSLIADFGSLRELLNAEAQRCLAQAGIGPARYAISRRRWSWRGHFARRCASDRRSRPPRRRALSSWRSCVTAVRGFLLPVSGQPASTHRFEELFRGTIDRAGVHPREVLRQTLLHNAAAVIFAHNHLRCARTSQADELITRRLKEVWASWISACSTTSSSATGCASPSQNMDLSERFALALVHLTAPPSAEVGRGRAEDRGLRRGIAFAAVVALHAGLVILTVAFRTPTSPSASTEFITGLIFLSAPLPAVAASNRRRPQV